MGFWSPLLVLQGGGTSLSTPAAKNGGGGGRPADRSATSLFFSQSLALLKKRLLTFGRDKKMWAFVVLMPLVFIGIGIALVIDFDIKDQPALALTPQVRPAVSCLFLREYHCCPPPLVCN